MQVVQTLFVLAVFVGAPLLLFHFLFSAPVPAAALGVCVVVVPYLAIRFIVRLRRVDRSVELRVEG